MKANIFKYAAVVFIVIGCISCKERVDEYLYISIRNRTDSLVHITLYRKGDTTGICYNPYALGGGCRSPKYNLPPYSDKCRPWEEMIFSSLDLNIKPYTLALREFDSIYIRTADNQIIFTHEFVTGYSENIFSEDSTWDFELIEWDVSDFSEHLDSYFQLIFNIKKQKLIINQ